MLLSPMDMARQSKTEVLSAFALSVFALLVLLIYPHNATCAPRLTQIRVLGSNRFDEAAIIRATGLKLGVEVPPQAFRDAANKLAATAAFTEVTYRYKPTGTGLMVEFQVTDAAKFVPCRFENLVWFSGKELQNEVRSRVPLFVGEIPLTGSLPEQINSALEDLLKERGIHGKVRYNLQGQLGGPVEAIQFRVEGVPIHIRRVNFDGAIQLHSSTLEPAVQALLGTDYDQPYVREFAIKNLTPLYWQQGYLRVIFDNPVALVIKRDASDISVAVTIPVNEGLQYRLSEIRWSGNSVFSSSELARHIHLPAGQLANAVQLERDIESIQDLYSTRGYLYALVESKPVLVDATHTVSYDLFAREGKLYRMGRLQVTGLDSSRSEALRKSCQLRTGDPFDKSYWKHFISDSGRYVPPNSQGWKVNFTQSINDAAKTVDVTVAFAPNTAP